MHRPLVLLTLIAMTVVPSVNAEGVDFGREILPLLSDNCFSCHGPDGSNRKAGLRLDQRETALAELKSGDHVIVAGESSKSVILERLLSTDPDEQMPPPESGKSLSKSEIATIKQWIDEGAEWGGHWAFEPPVKPEIPALNPDWDSVNAIDAFIQEPLVPSKRTPAKEADKETLIRRVTLDLTGLPPTTEEVETFLADDSDRAYEQVVDRLLRSKKYGENMARYWLDAARYADTHGLHLDNERSVWPYRDWTIKAFNENQPFDEFTIEQLAGDLLPKPRIEQRVATGFNRCNVTTGEGGSIDDEYYMRYAVDRVETTSTVWLGLTAGCAACHDHKFDPISQKEFYQLFSYFYSLTEKAMDGNVLLPPPSIKVPTEAQANQKVALQAKVTAVDQEIQKLLQEIQYEDKRTEETLGELESADRIWIDDSLPKGAKPDGNEGAQSWKLVEHDGRKAYIRKATGLSQHFFKDAKEPISITEGDAFFAYVYLDPKNPPETVQLQFHSGGWEHRVFWGADKGHAPGRNNASNKRLGDLPALGKWVRLEVDASSVDLKPKAKVDGLAFTQYGGTLYWDQAGVVTTAPLGEEQLASFSLWQQYRKLTKSPALPDATQKILEVAPEKRDEAQKKTLLEYYLQEVNPTTSLAFAEPMEKQTALKKELDDLEKAIPATLVMEERKEPRQAFILERGDYTQKGEKVESRVPEWIAPPVEGAPNNRLGLAQWLVADNHPLTARVTVNRYWQQFFGTGIVKTSADFGVQGEHPSHPKLLDWLALDFIESGWNVKRFMKQIAMSATYRQSSNITPEAFATDPENRLLSRGPRFRLDAEVIRDQALAVSGLLVEKTGGRSVKPYQPDGLWKPVAFGGSNTQRFVRDEGDKLYRRSMYTFWKRTSPPPSMTTFDAPDRETCQVRRARTNTPLQALVLMNDTQYIEAARKFAERIMRHGDDVSERLNFAYRSIVSRKPTSLEIESLKNLASDYFEDFKADEEAAVKLLKAGESSRDESLDPAEHAAWTMISHLLLNLSETVTKG